MKSLSTSLLLTLLGLGLLFDARSAAAQFLWQRAVGTAARSETAEYMVPVAGGFVTLGKYSSLAQNRTGLFLSKVNYADDTVWTKHWDLRRAGAIYPRGLFEDRAGNLVAATTTFGPPATPTAPPPPSEGRLVKFTAQGDTVWTRAVSAPANANLDVPVLGNDGNYVVIGDVGPSLPALFKFSPAGALLWTQPVFYNASRPGSCKTWSPCRAGIFWSLPPTLAALNRSTSRLMNRGCTSLSGLAGFTTRTNSGLIRKATSSPPEETY